MNMDIATFLRISGLLAIVGALVYAIGDVLLLASKANLADYPNLQPYAKTAFRSREDGHVTLAQADLGRAPGGICHAPGAARLGEGLY